MTDRSQYCAACEIEIGGPCRACLGLSERENIREWARLRVQPRALPDDIIRLLDHADAMDEQIAALTVGLDSLRVELAALRNLADAVGRMARLGPRPERFAIEHDRAWRNVVDAYHLCVPESS